MVLGQDAVAISGTGGLIPGRVVFKDGAQGIVLSRNHAGVKPENLLGAGGALRELGVI